MKKVFAIIAVSAMTAGFVSCGAGADLAAGLQKIADSLKADSIAKATAAAEQAKADSIANAAKVDTNAVATEAPKTEEKK